MVELGVHTEKRKRKIHIYSFNVSHCFPKYFVINFELSTIAFVLVRFGNIFICSG